MAMSLNSDVVDRLKNFRPIGWYSRLGSNLDSRYAKWGDCPDCQERCVWVDGRPTAIHEGGILEGEE